MHATARDLKAEPTNAMPNWKIGQQDQIMTKKKWLRPYTNQSRQAPKNWKDKILKLCIETSIATLD
jgi:protoheme ferro-lyase